MITLLQHPELSPSDFIGAWIGYCEEKGTRQTVRVRSACNEPAMKTELQTDFPATRIGRLRLFESARFPDLRNEANK
jgi:hypothetical protein